MRELGIVGNLAGQLGDLVSDRRVLRRVECYFVPPRFLKRELDRVARLLDADAVALPEEGRHESNISLPEELTNTSCSFAEMAWRGSHAARWCRRNQGSTSGGSGARNSSLRNAASRSRPFAAATAAGSPRRSPRRIRRRDAVFRAMLNCAKATRRTCIIVRSATRQIALSCSSKAASGGVRSQFLAGSLGLRSTR
jgi:hypothetical protein